MNIRTLLRFLLFDRQAIATVAAHPKSVLLGLIFVISAGFAREYDGEYLFAEPWHLLIPVAASLIGCMLLVGCLQTIIGQQGPVSFRKYLAVYWMTAPLAWIYGIPFERMLDPYGATVANLSLLAVVALWRVLLTIRCVNVLSGLGLVNATVVVLFFSACLSVAALWLVPGPIFMIMGGIRLTESENLVLNLRIYLGLASGAILFVGFFWFLYLAFVKNKLAQRMEAKIDSSIDKGLWALAVVSVLFWFAFLPATQKEQSLRYRAETLIYRRAYAELSELVRKHSFDQFPPHWDPPPRPSYREFEPSPIVACLELAENNAADWLQQKYLEKLVSIGRSTWLVRDWFSALTPDQVRQFHAFLLERKLPPRALQAIQMGASQNFSSELNPSGFSPSERAWYELKEAVDYQIAKNSEGNGQDKN